MNRLSACFFAASFALAGCNGSTSSVPGPAPATSVLTTLATTRTIGSTVDPLNGDQNPYGLAIAPVSAGLQTAGDLIVCNFSDAANTEGAGSSIVLLHPVVGATPTHMIANPALRGCSALIDSRGGNPWVAAFSANDNPIVSASGALLNALANPVWNGPWGQAFSGTSGPFGTSAFYASNAGDGSIVRINITSGGFTFDKIATGFSVNHGQPGNILAPAGLTYDAKSDTLYIVDGNENRVVALAGVTQIPAGGVIVQRRRVRRPLPRLGPGACPRARRSTRRSARPCCPTATWWWATPTTTTMVEITPQGQLAGTKLVDSGAVGALFGIVATGTSNADTLIYFNDDNDNTVKVLSH